MFLKVENKIIKAQMLSETELILYFHELCQQAKGNPWRGVEVYTAKEVLEELSGSKFCSEMKKELEKIKRYREKEVADPANEPMVTNWASAMARHYRKNQN